MSSPACGRVQKLEGSARACWVAARLERPPGQLRLGRACWARARMLVRSAERPSVLVTHPSLP